MIPYDSKILATLTTHDIYLTLETSILQTVEACEMADSDNSDQTASAEAFC